MVIANSAKYFQHTNSFLGMWLEKELNWLIDTETYSFMEGKYPLALTIFYAATVVLFRPAEESKDVKNDPKKQAVDEKKGKSKPLDVFTMFIFLHNVLLCVFSLCCFINTFPVAYDLMLKQSWKSTFCDGGWTKAFDGPFGYWGWLFYLSKYYEFVDTWIIMAKGRRPIFLQVYHHIGAVYSCWGGMTSRCSGYYLFVVLNSFIHTIMYCYYAFSTLGYQFKYKSIITSMQMVQFCTGNSILVWHTIVFGYCMHWADIFIGLSSVAYTTVLLFMFRAFFQKTYQTKKVHKKES